MKNKKITSLSRLFLTIITWVMFVLTWYNDYNDICFRTHKTVGFLITAMVWALVYLWLCEIFGAYSIASSSIGDIVISQLICIVIPDIFMCFCACLLYRRWIDFGPAIICCSCQLIIMSFTILRTKHVLMNCIIPVDTLVLYGGTYNKDNAEFFVERLLNKYRHLFKVSTIEDASFKNVKPLIDANERVIFAGVEYDIRKKLAKYCIEHNKIFYFIPDIEEIIFSNCSTKNLLDTPLKRFDFTEKKSVYLVVKRIIDFVIALLMLIVALPIMLIAAIAIKLEDGGPVLFKQRRVTKGERVFNIIKFRSMVVDADKYGVMPTTGKDPRITKVGAFCRKTRIDELPQLINILKGDMAFVGPRPERVEHVEKYEKEVPEFKYRHAVKGGLTGYAQVYGKYNTSPEDKLKLDLIYIMNLGFYTDFRLFLLTVRTVFQKESTEGFSKEQAKKMNETAC